MAVTLDNVTLNLVDYKRLTYDESDLPFATEGYPIGFTATSFQDLSFIQNLSVFGKMLNAGINRMDLYDANSQVIGNIQITNYQEIYVTAQPYTDNVDGIEYQYGNNAYMPYLSDSGSRHYVGGVKFKAFSGISSSQKMTFTVTLNNDSFTVRGPAGDGYLIKQVDDAYGSWNANTITSVIFEGPSTGDFIYSLGLVTLYDNGVPHLYLTKTEFFPEFYFTPNGSNQIVVRQNEGIIADNLSFTEHPIEEDGYVNELDDRFSPRAHSVMTGMYVIYADNDDAQMTDVAKAMFSFKFSDWVETHFFGSDGKDMVVGINWFYGLRATLAAKDNIIGPSDIRIGGSFLRTTDDPNDVIQANNLAREFIMWETPELYLNGKYSDYRDYLANYKIYLPYYGFADLDPNDAVNAYIKVYYNINLYSRAADIVITTRSARTNNIEEKIMTLTTTVGEEVPFGADACRNMMTALAQTAGKAITTGASIALGARGGQIDAAIASNSAANAYDTSMMSASIMSGNNVVDLNAASKGVTDKLSENASLRSKSAGVKAAQNAIPDMPNMALPATNRSNGSGSENGTLDELHPYVMISWPVTCEPNDWEDYVGMPASASTYLTANLGFTQVGAVHPDSMANAPKYLDEIIAQLKAGVYL